ncbi:ABC transporter [Natrinema longum]|uniref:ABC transporter n=1 Tax=Natrinema longum TaxID=370324 RepID=A0A8A2UBA6_9EURY|nr:ABC transporter [Natrinema longum]MBZ6496165.1 ABC transporter [Natrinema longum]QSW85910.1 ABC transporter [Natrinema longum]
MSGHRRLLIAVFEKQLILLKRYWLNTVLMLFGVYLMFAMVFFGGQTVGGNSIDSALDTVVIGFFLFLAASAAYFDVARSIMQEAQWGTLEQLYMSPFGIGHVLGVKTVFNIVVSIGLAIGLLGLMLVTTGRSLTVDLVTIVPLLVMTILPAVGIGYFIAGLSLLYKRIENVQQLLQFGFVGLIAAPGAVQGPILVFLPLSFGSDLLMRAMTDGTRLWEFSLLELTALVGSSVGYLVVGYVIFGRFVERTRKRGIMGHY